MSPIEEVASGYDRFCQQLGLSGHLKTAPQHDGSAHVEWSGDLLFYVVTERGSEFVRRATYSKDELLYWLIKAVVFEIASDFELKNRIKGQSFRRLLFAKEIELIGKLKSEWAERRKSEIDRILVSSPYDDQAEG
jgi:hypothetical protein